MPWSCRCPRAARWSTTRPYPTRAMTGSSASSFRSCARASSGAAAASTPCSSPSKWRISRGDCLSAGSSSEFCETSPSGSWKSDRKRVQARPASSHDDLSRQVSLAAIPADEDHLDGVPARRQRGNGETESGRGTVGIIGVDFTNSWVRLINRRRYVRTVIERNADFRDARVVERPPITPCSRRNLVVFSGNVEDAERRVQVVFELRDLLECPAGRGFLFRCRNARIEEGAVGQAEDQIGGAPIGERCDRLDPAPIDPRSEQAGIGPAGLVRDRPGVNDKQTGSHLYDPLPDLRADRLFGEHCGQLLVPRGPETGISVDERFPVDGRMELVLDLAVGREGLFDHRAG